MDGWPYFQSDASWNPYECHIGPAGSRVPSEPCVADSHLQPRIPVFAGVLGCETSLLALGCGDIRGELFAAAQVGPRWQFCQGGPAVHQVNAADCYAESFCSTCVLCRPTAVLAKESAHSLRAGEWVRS